LAFRLLQASVSGVFRKFSANFAPPFDRLFMKRASWTGAKSRTRDRAARAMAIVMLGSLATPGGGLAATETVAQALLQVQPAISGPNRSSSPSSPSSASMPLAQAAPNESQPADAGQNSGQNNSGNQGNSNNGSNNNSDSNNSNSQNNQNNQPNNSGNSGNTQNNNQNNNQNQQNKKPKKPKNDQRAFQRRIVLLGAAGIGGLGLLGGLVWFVRQVRNNEHFGWDEADAESEADFDPLADPDAVEGLEAIDPWGAPLAPAARSTRPRDVGPTLDAHSAAAHNGQNAMALETAAPIDSKPGSKSESKPESKPRRRLFPWQKTTPAADSELSADPSEAAAPVPAESKASEPATPAPLPNPAVNAAAPQAAPNAAPNPTAPLPSPTALAPTRVVQPSLIERAIQNLRSDNAADRRKAIWELGQRGDSRALRPLMDVLLNGDSKQRSLSIAALTSIGSRVLEPTLEAMALALRDPNPEVRTNAIRDLTQVYEQVTRLSQMMGMAARDPDQQVQQTASWALGKLEQVRAIAETVQTGGSSAFNASSLTESPLMAGIALLDNDQPAEAAPLLEAAIRQHPSDPDAHLALAKALEAHGAQAQALQAAIAARDLYAYQGRGEAAKAIEQTWQARGLDPDQAAYRVAWAGVLIQQEQWDEATKELEQAIAHNPHDPEPHLVLARLRRSQHRSAEAIEHLKQARDLYLALGDQPAADRLQTLIQSS